MVCATISASFVTVTKLATDNGDGHQEQSVACRWCRRPVDQSGLGRPRVFCKRSCRQRQFEARAKAARHGLDESELIVVRSELEQLRDELYVLQCAVEDVERDISATSTLAEMREGLEWVLVAARPLQTTLIR